VLLIDDQPMIGEAVRRMLVEESDIGFHYCADPTRAFGAIEQCQPTVILQDLVMPQMNGMDLVTQLRDNEETRDIPLIVLSTKEEPKVKAEGFARGANDYLVKLPDRVELIARIRYHSVGYIHLLERNEAYAELQQALKDLEVRNEFIRKSFGRYLTDDVVANLLESPDGLKVGGERREVTILMSDLRGFSSLADGLNPEQVVSLLNIYLGTMTDVILKYQGTIDEFIGDAILVIFGAPIWKPDHAERAVACALAMQMAMDEVNRQNTQAGFPQVEMGIGINTGEVVVGNIGSEKRAKYAVVGRDVNLASRIESYTVGGQILIAEPTYLQVKDLARIHQQMVVEPKGVKQPITIYDVTGMKEPYGLFVEPMSTETLRPLAQPLAVHYTVLEGKSVDAQPQIGELTAVSEHHAQLRTSTELSVLGNLRLEIAGVPQHTAEDPVYAKVVATDATQVYRIRFTSLSGAAKRWLLDQPT